MRPLFPGFSHREDESELRHQEDQAGGLLSRSCEEEERNTRPSDNTTDPCDRPEPREWPCRLASVARAAGLASLHSAPWVEGGLLAALHSTQGDLFKTPLLLFSIE